NSSDLAPSDRCLAPPAREGLHAVAGGIASRRIWHKLRRAVQRKRPPRGLHMGSPSCQLFKPSQFLVHTLERSRENLLAVEGRVDRTRETPAAWLGFAPKLTLLLAHQGAFLAAQLLQADAQRLQPVGVMLVNSRMVREAHDLMLFLGQQTALEFVGYGHLGIAIHD